jgi:hypothetical protein
VSKQLPSWAYGVLATAGAILLGSLVLLWVDVGGFESRGLSIAWHDNHWLFLVPLTGAALLGAAATRSAHTRVAAIAAGLVVAGYTMLTVAKSVVTGGLETYLILGGAGVMLASTGPKNAIYRGIGGAAVLAGFFAPWADFSMFYLLRHSMTDSLLINLLWLVPLAGVGGLLAAGAKHNGQLAAASGAAVYGSLVTVIGVAAWHVFGLGAWAAFGASSVALVVGLLARDGAASVAPAPKQLAA